MTYLEKRFMWVLVCGVAALFLFLGSGSLAYVFDSSPETSCTGQQDATQNC